MESEKMDRDSDTKSTDPSFADRLGLASSMEIRQHTPGCCTEMSTLLGCGTDTSSHRYLIDNEPVASTPDRAGGCCRLCCPGIHPFSAKVNDLKTGGEVMTIERPLACPVSPCKLCCLQTAQIRSANGQPLGIIKEKPHFCVPSFVVSDPSGVDIYLIHQPTCTGGCCTNWSLNGEAWIFHPHSENTNGNQVRKLGKIIQGSSTILEMIDDAKAAGNKFPLKFNVMFPPDANVEQKEVLVGSAVFLGTTLNRKKHLKSSQEHNAKEFIEAPNPAPSNTQPNGRMAAEAQVNAMLEMMKNVHALTPHHHHHHQPPPPPPQQPQPNPPKPTENEQESSDLEKLVKKHSMKIVKNMLKGDGNDDSEEDETGETQGEDEGAEDEEGDGGFGSGLGESIAPEVGLPEEGVGGFGSGFGESIAPEVALPEEGVGGVVSGMAESVPLEGGLMGLGLSGAGIPGAGLVGLGDGTVEEKVGEAGTKLLGGLGGLSQRFGY